MTFAENVLREERPDSILEGVVLPRRQAYHPSPVDWQDEVLYFLLVDRFSDGREAARPLLDRQDLDAGRRGPDGAPWRWDKWAYSGAHRWQGGTLRGVASKLGYLQDLGITALWLSPVFKQRGHLDTYHGYGIQDFLEVDPRFGDRRDLVDLVAAAHAAGMRVILDIIFNHSGANWVYPGGEYTPGYLPYPGRHAFGRWLDGEGRETDAIGGPEDGVWPLELQGEDFYTRAGSGDLGAGAVDDPAAEHKRSDFFSLRDFRLEDPGVLTFLAQCYKYWIALTDCDGFRIDTVKHVSFEQARNFCGSIKEFAAGLGKKDFFLVGEIAGGDDNQDRYLEALDQNMNAALDIGEMRLALRQVAQGLAHPSAYFEGFKRWAIMGSHRNQGERHVSILDDHDHVFGEKLRFSSGAANDHQVVAGAALQLFTLGIPCIYYGTEQALAGPERSEWQWLPGWGGGDHADRYLREAMFGPEHPRKAGRDGLAALDGLLPGFGAFGTSGQHCFDPENPVYRRVAALAALRKEHPALRLGRQYLRPFSFLGKPFAVHGPGEMVAWSRILDGDEVLCVLNAHGLEVRGADVVVDGKLNPPGGAMTVLINTDQVAGGPPGGAGGHEAGSSLEVRRAPDGTAYVEIRDLAPSEVLVLANHPDPEVGGLR